MLGHHGNHLGMPQQDFPHLARGGGARIERHRRWHGRPDPEIALLQRRQEFAAEPGRGNPAEREKRHSHHDGDPEMGQRPAKHRRITRPQGAHDLRLGLLNFLRQQQCGQNRRHRESREQRAGQRVAIGPGHRSEDLAFNALHGEQRHERRDRDRRREENRLVDLQRADEDDAQSLRPLRGWRRCGHSPMSDQGPNSHP